MSKTTITKTEVDNIDEFLDNFDLDDDDYILVVGSDGKLKNVFLPESEVFEPHENIQRVLNVFGIQDVDFINGSTTLH